MLKFFALFKLGETDQHNQTNEISKRMISTSRSFKINSIKHNSRAVFVHEQSYACMRRWIHFTLSRKAFQSNSQGQWNCVFLYRDVVCQRMLMLLICWWLMVVHLLSNLANLLLGVWLWKCSLYSCLHAASSGQSDRLYVAATDVLNQDNIWFAKLK